MSLTPESRSNEATAAAAFEGLFNGVLTLIPTMGVVGYALQKYPEFARRTNWQSRTAITIMPAVFVAAWTSELKLSHKMREIAQETQHSRETVRWAEEQWQERKHDTHLTEREHATALYQQSVRSASVCVVPELRWYHRAANFAAQNPIKVLAAAAVPTYVWIFRGRRADALATKLMHTRVLGQAAAIGMLLAVMGFKDWMDANGRFISEAQANDRVRDMQMARQELLERLEQEQRRKADQKAALKAAKERDAVLQNSSKSRQKIPMEAVADELTTDASSTPNPMATASTKES